MQSEPQCSCIKHDDLVFRHNTGCVHNIPQVSPELERQFEHYDKIKCPWCWGQEEEHCHCDGYGVVTIAYVLAQALEDQRLRYVQGVEKLKVYRNSEDYGRYLQKYAVLDLLKGKTK